MASGNSPTPAQTFADCVPPFEPAIMGTEIESNATRSLHRAVSRMGVAAPSVAVLDGTNRRDRVASARTPSAGHFT